MKLVGRIMLLVTGILLVIAGIYNIVNAATVFAASIKDILAGVDGAISNVIAASIAIAIAILILLFDVLAGVRGIKTFVNPNHRNATKAFIWAIIILVLTVVSFATGDKSPKGIIANAIGSATGIVYIIGAFFVKLSK